MRVFVSYSHDSPEHVRWVEGLAARIVESGVDVILDQWDLRFGKDLSAFMEEGLAAADRVLVVCTDPYLEKANAKRGGVGYERQIVTRELVDNAGTEKFIPVIRGSTGKKTPVFLGARFYADFSDDDNFEGMLQELVRQLRGAPPPGKPSLGPNPYAGASTKNVVDPEFDRMLARGVQAWRKAEVIVTKFEEFLELVVRVDEDALTDDQKAFLCCAAAHFGKFMKRMSDVARSQQQSIEALVKTAAQSTYLRVGWRSAIMLEHFDEESVDAAVRSFGGPIRNKEWFPHAILERRTVARLRARIADESTTSGTRDKLNEALRQVEDEFGASEET